MTSFWKKRYNSIDMDAWITEQEVGLLFSLLNQPELKGYSKLEIDLALAKHAKPWRRIHPATPIDEDTAVVDEITRLKKIRDELVTYYFPDDPVLFEKLIAENDTWSYELENGKSLTSPRATYLIWQYNKLSLEFPNPQAKKITWARDYLSDLLKIEQAEKFDEWLTSARDSLKQHVNFQSLKEKFDVFKKIADTVDDLWNAIGRNFFAQAVVEAITILVVGIATTFIHAVESLNGLWVAGKAFFCDENRSDKQIQSEKLARAERIQEKTLHIAKIVTGVATAIVGAVGMACGLAGMLLKNILISSISQILMTGVVAVGLARRVVRYFRTDENLDEIKYEKVEGTNIRIDLKARLEDKITIHKSRLTREAGNANSIAAYHKVFQLDHELTRIHRADEKASSKLAALAFGALELATSFIVSAGIVVSKGTLTLVGVALSFTFKVMEQVNEKYNVISRTSNWLDQHAWTPFKNLFTTNTETPQPEPQPQRRPDLSSEKIRKWLQKASVGTLQEKLSAASVETTVVPSGRLPIPPAPVLKKHNELEKHLDEERIVRHHVRKHCALQSTC